MAKGQHLSAYQQKIVKRYYQNLDTIALTKLAELVSDLAVADDPKSAAKLWTRAADALKRIGVDAGEVDAIVAAKDTKRLATFVGDLWNSSGSGGGSSSSSSRPPAKRDSRSM